MPTPPAIIFTDLDGTLLDHDSYDWSPAAPLLTRLTQAGIPVVLASSKTAAEMVPLREAMGLSRWPMICENGAGIVPAGAKAVADGRDQIGEDYAGLRAALERIEPDLRRRFEGFGDMGTDRIAEVTGLPAGRAGLAAERAFSEPGLWHGDVDGEAALIAALAGEGVVARRGGRFLTLSRGGTKADRMGEISARFGSPRTIALGDAPNDAEMLEAADHGIVVANPHGPGLPRLAGEETGRIRRTSVAGPCGWTAGLTDVLSAIGIMLE
ncbi:MAG: HAD-IIB family hydrolase [Marinibacterium sp.]